MIEEAELASDGRPLVLVSGSEGVAAQSLVRPSLAGNSVVQLLVVLCPRQPPIVLVNS